MNQLNENDSKEADSDADDPENLLNEWLGELNNLTGGLDSIHAPTHLKPLNSEITTPRIDSYRFSMANLEDSQDVDLDAILGELCALETECEREIGHVRDIKRLTEAQKVSQHLSRAQNRSSENARLKLDSGDNDIILKTDSVRTESPDNDSAFSDTVSMLSSESSASSGNSGIKTQVLHLQNVQDEASKVKAEKIRMAMEKIKEANIQKLFVKVFTTDGSAKSLLIDEKMLCSYVTRLLADKNHVQMDPKWAIVEHLPNLYMERIYEDHEFIVDNLMVWTRDSKNKIYFSERPDKIKLFVQPEKFLLPPTDKKEISDYDEHSRNMLLEEFFSSSSTNIPELEGPLYLKAESKKGWKKYHFVLRASGLYYIAKDKVKCAKDLTCLATFDNNQIYYGLGWKKKYKAPTDFCFAIKHPRLQEPKSSKYIKYLCAEDQQTFEKWIVGIRIAKHGRQLMENYRCLMDELAQDDLDILAHARSCSVSSIAIQSNITIPTQGYPNSENNYATQNETYSVLSEANSGRHSRASSSSSSGCMSDGAPSSCENAFDSEFPMGTIKRKPSMKPSLPLTNITRQLKEVGETRDEIDGAPISSSTSPISYTNTGTLTRRYSRRKSNNSSDDSSNSGTLKRQHSYKNRGSIESVGSRSGNSTPLCGTPVRDKASPIEEKKISFCERSSSSGSIRSPISPINMDIPACMTDSITSLPPPPPEANNDMIINDSSICQLPSPPPEIYNSNQSLDSLPPPPNPNELPPLTGAELTGSQLSLMSLPPPPDSDSGTMKRRKDLDKIPTQCVQMSPEQTPTHSRLNTPCFSPPLLDNGSNCSTPTQLNPPISFSPTHYTQNGGQMHAPITINYDRSSSSDLYASGFVRQTTLPGSLSFSSSNGLRSSLRQFSLPRQISTENNYDSSNVGVEYQTKNSHNSAHVQKKVNFQEPASPKKIYKKISFNLTPQELPPLPRKPLPPKRSDTTKLSSPRKLVEPQTDFLKDLQRVMRKKWQVAQKCKLEPTTTPHEVLGFRDPPILLPDYKEHNVSNWVQEHYGPNNVYENVYRDNVDSVTEYVKSPIHGRNEIKCIDNIRFKRPPPPPPKRSETTHLSAPKMY